MRELLARFRAARLVAALLAVVFLAAACGSGTDDADASADNGSDDAVETDGDMAEDEMADDEMADDEMADGGHSHSHDEVIELPDGMDVPDIGLRVQPDPISGFNLFIDVKDFNISPENASTEPRAGEGHLHLYIDGERQMRFYNSALHIDGLSEGEHEITVEVSANNHSAYALDGEPIRVTETVTVEAGAGNDVGDEPYQVDDAGDPAITLEVSDDPKSGWNLFFGTSNLDLSPETAGTDPVPNEGHLILAVDGEDQGRIYGQWWHLKALPEGEHEIVVTLVANNGAPYLVDGEPVQATASVTVTPEQAEAAAAGSHGGGDEAMDEMSDSEDENMEDMQERGPVIADANLRIEVAVDGDQVTVESDRFQIPRDFTVTVVVTADSEDEVHVHGYDFLADVAPGAPAEIIFEADIPGVFEVELESSGLFLFELAVVE